MPFQFYCPQGHLLEGHEQQMGTPGQCPMCGSMFVFPVIGGGAPPGMPAAPGGYAGGGYTTGGGAGFPGLTSAGGFAPAAPEPPPEPRLFRIVCPKGHQVQTPEEMLGTKAQCPYCNAVLDLKYENSIEYKEEQDRVHRQQELEQRIVDERRGRFWMRLAVLAAVLIGGAVVALFVYIFTGVPG